MRDNSYPKVGHRIRKIREERGITISELARKTNISRGHLYSVERGESSITEDKLQSIARVFGLLVSELLGEIEVDDLSELPGNIPSSLRKLAEEDNLPPADIVMLSKINYRGKRPETVNEWRVLYTIIKGTLDKD